MRVWRTNLEAGDLQASVRDSLDRLDVDYGNLLLLHWPYPGVDAAKSLPAAAELRNEGLVEHLDISNYARRQLERAREAVAVSLHLRPDA
jgi:diketogulonate reductase-like aldo/keto reductase